MMKNQRYWKIRVGGGKYDSCINFKFKKCLSKNNVKIGLKQSKSFRSGIPDRVVTVTGQSEQWTRARDASFPAPLSHLHLRGTGS